MLADKEISPDVLKLDPPRGGWLSRNIQPVLALIIVILTFMIFSLVLLGNIKPRIQESNLAMMVLGGLLTLVAQVVSYFFGSSRDAGRKSPLPFMKKKPS